MPLSTAAHVVSALDSRVDERLRSMFKVQSYRSYTGEIRFLRPHSELRRDLIMVYFHEIHRTIHPGSAIHQLEYIARLLNSPEHWRLRPYLEWPVQDINAYPEGKSLVSSNFISLNEHKQICLLNSYIRLRGSGIAAPLHGQRPWAFGRSFTIFPET